MSNMLMIKLFMTLAVIFVLSFGENGKFSFIRLVLFMACLLAGFGSYYVYITYF